LPSLRSAAPSQDRKSENSNAHGITPVQNYICQRSFIIAVQMAKDMRQRIYLAVFMLLTYRAMSALGQKQTFAPQKAMSALTPKATFAAHSPMSALGQKQTLRKARTSKFCDFAASLFGTTFV
jgi:hypothetical protein